MNSILSELKSRNFLVTMLLLQLFTSLLILFDVPVARQVVGFVYFTVVPGYILVKLLKLEAIGKIETLLLSVGFSVALLMFAGFFINDIFPLLGMSRPLSLIPMMVILNILIISGEVLVCLRSTKIEFWKFETSSFPSSALLLIGLPILSIIGAASVNTFGSNVILLILILAISVLLAVGVLKSLPSKVYPVAVLLIAVSLLFQSSLISKYLVSFGSDIPLEYYIAQSTVQNGQWTPAGLTKFGRFDPMLSITILPASYLTLLNMDLTSIFKILYPLVFSLVPLGLYMLWERKLGAKGAFIAAFLVMAQEVFYTEMLGLARQMIAELFFVLLLLLVLNTKMEKAKRMICFVILGSALVMSHYSLSLLFIFFIAVAFVFLRVIRRPSRNISLSMVLIFLVIMFSWYIYTSHASAFYDILSYGNFVYDQLGQWLNPAARGSTIVDIFSPAPSVWNDISRAFAYLTQFLIVVGFVAVLTKKVASHFKREYTVLNSIAVGFLVAIIVVPGLARTFNMTRFYHLLLFFIAPLLVLGADFLVKLISKRKAEFGVSILLVTVLVPYFLFQTSFVYEITGSQSWSISLSGYRMDAYQLYSRLGYTDESCVVGTLWMSKNVNVSQTQIYSDAPSAFSLYIYGDVRLGHIVLLTNDTDVSFNGTVYLGPLAVIYNKVASNSSTYDLDELSFLKDMDKIYSNGRSEIYRK